jgi:MFS family permease
MEAGGTRSSGLVTRAFRPHPDDSDPVPPAMPSSPQPGTLLLRSLLLALFCTLVGFLSARKLGFGVVPGTVIGLSILGVGAFAMLRLGSAPPALWFTFALKLFSVTAYKLLNSTLVLWMAADLGFSDAQTSALITTWAITMSVITLLVGSVTDAIGIRRTLIIGVTLCLLTRLVMAFTGHPFVALAFGLFPLAVGEALCTPVLVAALRKVTTTEQRTVAFSLFYAIMNFGFMVSWFIFDAVKSGATPGGPLAIAGLSPYRTLLLTSFAIEALLLPFIFLLPRDAPDSPADTAGQSIGATIRSSAKAAAAVFGKLIREPGFGRLLAFLAFIGCLKVVFNVMDYVLPKFTMQELGPDVKVGRFNAINGILILVLAPVIGVLTRRASSWSMVIVGGFLTAASFLFMCLPPSAFAGLANGTLGHWIGHGYMELKGPVNPWYIMIVLWQIGFSLGEAFYSPRVYEYAAAIAPKGQEASYASLSYVPLLIGKLLNGALFGFIFTAFYPAGGTPNPSGLWTVIAALVLVAPVGLLALQRFIRVREEGRD